LPKTTIFGLHFWCRERESNLAQCDVIGPKCLNVSEMTQRNGHSESLI